jgi:CelD/BcsL family acetyltransferase involved in cellulose biosynthesis
LGLIETHHSHYPDFLYAKGEGGRIKEILNHLKKTHNAWAIELPQRVDCSETSEFIKSIAGKRWLVLRRNPNVMRIIDIGESVESYLEGKTKKVRHELQRKKRKIEKEGFVELERLRNEADTEKLFDAMSEIERDSWKFESGTAIISSETEKSFYRNVFRIYCRESAARGYILRVDGNPVSYLIGIVYDGTLYALKTSYKETYGKFSPGTVLFLYIIELIIRDDRKINRIELLGGDARWKEELATRFQSVCTYGLYPIRISSLAFYLAYRYIRPEFRKIMGSRVWRRRPQKEPL